MFQYRLYKQFIGDAQFTFQRDFWTMMKDSRITNTAMITSKEVPAFLNDAPKQFKERVSKIHRSPESPIIIVGCDFSNGNEDYILVIASGSERNDFVGLILKIDETSVTDYKLGWGEDSGIAVMDWKETFDEEKKEFVLVE